MNEEAVFESAETFQRWDHDYYPAVAQRYYDRAIGRMLDCLGAQPDDLVLDAGCGLGDHSIRLARRGCRAYAIDISGVAIEEAERRAAAAGLDGRIVFKQADLTNLQFDDESFDRIFSWGVVIHIPDAERALAELVRILRPGGRLALYVTNAHAWDHSLLAAGRFLLRRPSPPLERLPLGPGCWYDMQGRQLWVWYFDIHALTRHLECLGLRRIHRIPGSFTEIQRRLRGSLRQALLRFNDAWYRLRLPARPCATNLLVFEKPTVAETADGGPDTEAVGKPSDCTVLTAARMTVR